VVRRVLPETRAALRGATDADLVEAYLGELDREEQAGRPHGSGSDLINVYLSESRVEKAWQAAK